MPDGPPTTRRVLWLSRYSLLSMLLGTLPLSAAPQGQDILVSLAERHEFVELTMFYFTLSLWALSVWYWTRVVLDAELTPQTGAAYRGMARHLPRVLGAATLLLPAYPLSKAAIRLQSKLLLISGCAALALAFLVFITQRHKFFRSAIGPSVTGFSIGAARATLAGTFTIVSLAVSWTFFGWFVFAPFSAARVFGAAGILFVAVANTVFFGSLAVFFSQTWRWPIDLLALLLAAIFSLWNDNHAVSADALGPLQPLTETFSHWSGAADPGAPVFVVAAEGGGIRAAFWAATVLGNLSKEADGFSGRLFLVSGVSGGTLGSAVYASLHHDYPEGGVDVTRKAQTVLSHDFLGPTLAKLVTGDFLQWLLPFPVHAFDRSLAMEAAYRESYRLETGRGTFSERITVLAPDAATGVPALAMNITRVEAGSRVVLAPFTWTPEEMPETRMYTQWAAGPGTAVAPLLAEAIHNSARFLYISPAGRVSTVADGIEHVVDGGYFDDTGIDTLMDVVRVLKKTMPALRVVPIFVSNAEVSRMANGDDAEAAAAAELRNAPASTDIAAAAASKPANAIVRSDTDAAAPVQLLGEVFHPVRALIQSRPAHGRGAVARLHQQFPGAVTFGFCEMDWNGTTWTERTPSEPGDAAARSKPSYPPLGWQLSPPMVQLLDAYWTCEVNQRGLARVRAAITK